MGHFHGGQGNDEIGGGSAHLSVQVEANLRSFMMFLCKKAVNATNFQKFEKLL